MSFNKVNRVSTSFANTPSRGRINGSRFVQDQNEPRLNNVSTGSKSDGDPQSRASQAGGLNSRGTNANQPTRHAPSQGGGSDVPEWAGEPEPNFLDLALEESEDDSDDSDDSDNDEWEEVACVASNTVVDRPLIAAPSGFTLPTRGKRSEVLTLEVVEDWQPSSLPSSSHTGDPRKALPGDVDNYSIQGSADEQDDSLEADLQLELELAEGLADLDTPVPGPSRRVRSNTPDVVGEVANASPPSQHPTHPTFKVAEQPPLAHASVKGKEGVVDCEPHKTGKQASPPQVSPTTGDLPARKPVVSFKKKATELARATGKLLAPSKPLPSCNLATIPPLLTTTEDPSPAPSNPPHLRTQAASDSSRSTSQLFRSRDFSNRVQNFREKQTEETSRRFSERYGGVIVEHARRDLVGLTAAYTSTGSSERSKGRQPIKKRQVQETASGKRISKARAQAEEVKKICRSTKSYIVDMAAFKRRQVPTPPEPQRPTPTVSLPSTRPLSIRPEEATPATANQQVSKTRPAAPSLAPQPQSTSSGSIPRGLKFTKKPRPAPEPGEVTETAGRATVSERDVRGPRFASTSRYDGPPAMNVSKRRREDAGREVERSSPRKKSRLSRS